MGKDEDQIRDTDLRAELEAKRGTDGFEFALLSLSSIQRTRDKARDKAAARGAALAALPRVQRKRAVARDIIETGDAVSPEYLRHIHSVLALCGMPYTRLPVEVREFERRNGRMSLVIEAGKLMTPQGAWEPQPLPHGSRARLLMLHLCSEAVRQKSPTVEIADSLSAFIRDMGFAVTGGKNGTLTYFKQQVNALAACRMRIGVWGQKGATTIETKPFSRMDVWLPQNPGQHMLWPSTVVFSAEFFESLTHHALPMNMHVARAFAGSARKLDILFWLSYRLKDLNENINLSWLNLQQQFGDQFTRPRAFREVFKNEIEDICKVLPKVPITLSEKGLTLSPAPPEVLALPAPRRLAKR